MGSETDVVSSDHSSDVPIKQEPWFAYYGTRELKDLPAPPPWRNFADPTDPTDWIRRGGEYKPSQAEVEMVNAALYLRRPLLLTGRPGVGKSSLALSVAAFLKLQKPIVWPITTRSTLTDALYRYDAIGRLQSVNDQSKQTVDDIGKYLRLGPLGTALATSAPGSPRVLLVDEIDKCDIDLPSDLLNVLEEGEFTIPELERLSTTSSISIRPSDAGDPVVIENGRVKCKEFPFVILTSNSERDFSPALLRRCIRLEVEPPNTDRLGQIVAARLADESNVRERARDLIQAFEIGAKSGTLATDQLLNAIYLAISQEDAKSGGKTVDTRAALTLEKLLQDRLLRLLR